jgi:hypothetical protein
MDSISGSRAVTRWLRSKAHRHATTVFALALALCGARSAHAGGGTLNAEDQEVNLTVMFRYPPPQEDLDTLEESLIEASAMLCDATEGQLRLGTITVRATSCEGMGCQTGSDQADILLTWSDSPTAGNGSACGGQGEPCTSIGKNGTNISLSHYHLGRPLTFAHELGHYVLNLADSYEQYQCRDYRPPYGQLFTCDSIETQDATVTSLMMAAACGEEGHDYSELTTQATMPDLGQGACAVDVDCDADTMCPALGGYNADYDGYVNDGNVSYPVCQAFNPAPGVCRFEWPATYWWSTYKFGELLSEMDQAALSLEAANGGVPFFQDVTTEAPEAGVPEDRELFCGVAPQIVWEVDVPDQVMLVLDRSWSMAFADSDYEKCDPLGCPELCGNGVDDDADGSIDEMSDCKSARIDKLKAFALDYVDLMAAAQVEGIETGVMSFSCGVTEDVPLTVATSTNATSTFKPAIEALAANGKTAIVDALYQADAQLDGASKAIVLATDGFTSCGDDDVTAAIDELRSRGTRVYVLSYGPAIASTEAAQIAAGTQGRFLSVGETDDLGPAFARQWANFTNSPQLIPQLPYRLSRQASLQAPPKSASTWVNNDAPPAYTPGMERFNVFAEPGTNKLLVLLSSDHENLSGFGLRAKLVGPAGPNPSSFDTAVPSSHMKVTRRAGYMLLELNMPNPGQWQVQLTVPNQPLVSALQTGYITVLSRAPNARLSTNISRAVVDDPAGGVDVEAYPRWGIGEVFDATVTANLIGPTGVVTPLDVDSGKGPTDGYRVHVPPPAIQLEGIYEVRLQVVAGTGTMMSEGEWAGDVPVPASFVRTASESFVVASSGCGQTSCLQN